jgi:hypothetical protein
MKEKVFVRLQLPIANRSYDVRLPYDAAAGIITDTLVKMLRSQQPQELPLQASPMLWSAREGKPLAADRTLHEQGILDSELLYLI